MLLLIEIFDTIAGILVLTELCLVLLGVELGLFVPKLQHLDVHYWVKAQCQTSGARLLRASACCTNLRPQRRTFHRIHDRRTSW